MKSHAALSLWSGPVTPEGVELFPNDITFTLPPDCKLTDNQALNSAERWNGTPCMHYAGATPWGCWHFSSLSPVPVYDDSWGPAFIHRDSGGINGIARARTWEDAYGIVEDEFLPAATETEEEWIEEYGEGYTEDACWQEAYGYRSNGRKEADGTVSTIYQKDLNGDRLDTLTCNLRAELNILLYVQNQYSDYAFGTWSDGLNEPYKVS